MREFIGRRNPWLAVVALVLVFLAPFNLFGEARIPSLAGAFPAGAWDMGLADVLAVANHGASVRRSSAAAPDLPAPATPPWRGQAVQADSPYVQGEVVVRLRETGALSLLQRQAYRQRKAAHDAILARLSSKYHLGGARPLFQTLHNQVHGEDLSATDWDAKIRSLFPKRQSRAGREAPTVDLLPIYVVKTDGPEREMCARLSKDPEVKYATVNHVYECHNTPNDPTFPQQWGLGSIQAPAAWDVQTGSDDVVVAVVDTGVDWDHPDLNGNLWINQDEIDGDGIDNDGNGCIDDVRGWDFVAADPSQVYPGEDPGPPDNNPMDFYGHGTCVSGIIAAVTDNALGVAGVSWRSKIMALRAGYRLASGSGVLQSADIAQALHYAADNGADVINMSFGGSETDALMDEALQYAQSHGCVLVASAGNSGSSAPNYPAAYQDIDVIAVAATYDTSGADKKASFSNFAKWVDVSAPGVGIHTTSLNDKYVVDFAGTSASAPFVSGLAALVISHFPDVTAAQVRQRIMATADPIDSVNPQYAGMLGTGRINAWRALAESERPCIGVDGYTIPIDPNGNGFPDPGETVGVQVSLRNDWGTAAAVHATLRTQDARITIIQNGADFGDIAPDGIAQGSAAFSLHVGETVKRGETITFLVDVVSDGGTYSVTQSLPVKITYLWPISTGGAICSSAVFVDINEDGRLDILIGSANGWVYALNQDGTDIPGWPVYLGYAILDSPAVGDVTGDGHPEVVVNTDWAGDSGNLFVLDRHGQVLSGWPRLAKECNAPVLADLDENGVLEILVSTYGQPNGYDVYLHAFRADGTELPGWPVVGISRMDESGPPAVGDVDGDGHLEVVATGGISVFIWNAQGQRLYGCPFRISSGVYPTLTSSTLADLDGDGDLEILTGSQMGKVHAIHHTGQALSGWPVTVTGDKVCAAPVVGDVDDDGVLEIFVATLLGKVHAWKANAATLPGWPASSGYAGMNERPSLFDINNDGKLEVFFGKSACDYQGHSLSGWGTKVQGLGTPANAPAVGLLGELATCGVVLGTESPDGKIALVEAGPLPAKVRNKGWPVFGHDMRHSSCYLPAWPGDVDGDGHVNVVDLLFFVDSFGRSTGEPGYDPACDFNDDGSVDVADLLALVENFGK